MTLKSPNLKEESMAEENKAVKEAKKPKAATAGKEPKAPKEHVAKVEVKRSPKGQNTVLKLANGKKLPKYTQVKKTAEYTIWKKRNGRYSIKDKENNWVNGDKKVQILLSQGLVKISVKKAA